MYSFEDVEKVDPQIAALLKAEFERQNSHIELIASENWVSKAVMGAMGSVLTNKYAEGYPSKRYYGGCQYVDVVEDIARERAKKLFGISSGAGGGSSSGSSAPIGLSAYAPAPCERTCHDIRTFCIIAAYSDSPNSTNDAYGTLRSSFTGRKNSALRGICSASATVNVTTAGSLSCV